MMKKKAKTIGVFEFLQRFPDEDAAVAYFETMRWGRTPACARCGATDKITDCVRQYFRWCGHCRKYFTVKIGTAMEASNLPIQKWLYAMYLLLTARKGISSLQLSKELQVSQPTAWFLLHRLRESCGLDGRPLRGRVEIDETYIGGLERNKHAKKKLHKGRGAVGKQAVLGLRERGGRVKAFPIQGTDRHHLQQYILNNVATGTTVYTDDHGGYHGLARHDFEHATVKHSAKEYVNGMAHTNGIESVWAVLKRGYNGVYHQWSMKHMRRYVNEFAFRLNEGNVTVNTMDRIAALSHALVGTRLKHKDLVA